MTCIWCGNPNSDSKNCPCRCDTDEESEYNNEDEIMERNHDFNDRDLDDNKIISGT